MVEHLERQQARKEAAAVERQFARVGDELATVQRGRHVTFNLGDELRMYDRHGFSRVKEVYVRKQKKGHDVIERYEPDGSMQAIPNINYEERDEFRGDYVCGQEILIVPNFVPEVSNNQAQRWPESKLPAEFAARQKKLPIDEE